MLIRISFFAALGGFLFGYDLGLIGAALLGISEELGIDDTFSKEAIVGSLKFGAFFGTFLGGALMLRYGRRPAITATAVTGVLGPVVMAAAWNTSGLVVGRLLSGLGIGVSAIVVPAYLAELAPAVHRGAMVQVYEVMLCTGMLSSTIVDWALHSIGPSGWRWMVGLPAIPGAVIGLALLVLPESPRWLVMQGRLDEALATLQAILQGTILGNAQGGPGPEQLLADAEDELLLLWSSVEKDKQTVMERRASLMASRSQRVTSSHSQHVGREPLLAGAGAPSNAWHMRPQQLNQSGELAGGYSQQSSSDPSAHMFSITSEDVQQQGRAGAAAVGQGQAAGVRGAADQEPVWPVSDGMSPGDDLLVQSTADGGGGFNHPAHLMPGHEKHFLATLGAMLLDVKAVLSGPEANACIVTCCLAVFNQATASTAIINYAPTLLSELGGLQSGGAIAYTIAIAMTKVVGVGIGLVLVDVLGRRPLLIWGALGSAAAMVCATASAAVGSAQGLLACMCFFILAFSVSWAGVYWVVVSEVFSMSVKSPASSLATSLLFMSGSITNLVFLALVEGLGAYSFLLFAGVAVASAGYVWHQLPETKGRTLAEVQVLINRPGAGRA